MTYKEFIKKMFSPKEMLKNIILIFLMLIGLIFLTVIVTLLTII